MSTTSEEKSQAKVQNSNARRGNKGNRKFTPKDNKKEFIEEVIQIDRVTRVVKGGRRLRFRATVVIGDKKGNVGVGLGKASDVVGGIQKAISQAKKSLIKVPIVNGTIPHQIKAKFKASRLLLMPGREGSGIIAGGAVRKVCELAGIENIVTKSLGTNNKVVNAQATIVALQKLYKPKQAKKQENGDVKQDDIKKDANSEIKKVKTVKSSS